MTEYEKEQREFRHRRELFAGMAMQGILSDMKFYERIDLTQSLAITKVAGLSVKIADALIKELEKKKDE